MGKLVKNSRHRENKIPKKDKIIFAILLAVGIIPLAAMILAIIVFLL